MNSKLYSTIEKLLIFKSCGRLIGLELLNVKEISDHKDIINLPQIKKPFLGLGKSLNKIMPILDLGSFLNKKRSQNHKINKWVVCENSKGIISLAVDEIIGIKEIKYINKSPKNNKIKKVFNFNGREGDLINLKALVPQYHNPIEKKTINPEDYKPELNLPKSEESSFICYENNNKKFAISLSQIVSVKNISEFHKPWININEHIFIVNINNQLVPLVYFKSENHNVIIIKFLTEKENEKIFGISCERIIGIVSIEKSFLFFEKNPHNEIEKRASSFEDNQETINIIYPLDLINKFPLDNWMPKNQLKYQNKTEKVFKEYLVFRIKDFNMAFPLNKIKRVASYKKPKEIMGAKKGVLGVTELDQNPNLIIDIAQIFKLSDEESISSPFKGLVFLEINESTIVLVVHEIFGIEKIEEHNLKSSSNINGIETFSHDLKDMKIFLPSINDFDNKIMSYLK